MLKDPEFLSFKTGADGYIARPHQKSQLHFVGAETLTWTSGIALPVFWSIFFAPEHLASSGAVVDGATALALVTRREKSLHEKSSALVAEGLTRFIDWAKRTRADRIELDLSDLETWRHAPLLAAFGQLTRFFDGASDDPGPLPPRDDAAIGWRARKTSKRLETFVKDLAWPDALASRLPHDNTTLLYSTLGTPPFRNAPWPEWRLAKEDSQTPEARAHAKLVSEALGQCPNHLEIKPIGNLEGIDRMRTHHRATCVSFQQKARELVATSKAFAAKYQVVDETAHWQALLDASVKWLAQMEESFVQQERDVRAAMQSMTGAGNSDREIDFDHFPSGDDPF